VDWMHVTRTWTIVPRKPNGKVAPPPRVTKHHAMKTCGEAEAFRKSKAIAVTGRVGP
jgi:hypothetical protein